MSSMALFAGSILMPLHSHLLVQRASQQQTTAIEGVVSDPAGEPAAGASVLLQGSDKQTVQTKTDAQGKFVFPHCSLDAYSIYATKPGFGDSAIAPLKVTDPGTVRISLILKPRDKASTNRDAQSAASASSPGEIKFDDKPTFVIAGVKDWSNADLHGSAVNGRTSEALNQGTRALTSDVEANAAMSSPAVHDADAHRLSGDRFEKEGHPVAAEREYEAAVRLSPSEQNYFAWGAELLLHKANQPAIEVFTRGATAHPKSWRMRAGLGAALYAGNSYEEAAQRLCESADLSPHSEAPHIFLGEIERSTTAPLPCAEEKLARFAEEQTSNARASYYYAIALWKRARPSESKNLKTAEALLEKAIALDPAFAEAYLQLGILFSDSGAPQRSVAAYQKAVEIKPGLAEAHHRLALAYRHSGENAKAQQEFAAYERAEKAEAANLEKQHQQLGQFLVILGNVGADSRPH